MSDTSQNTPAASADLFSSAVEKQDDAPSTNGGDGLLVLAIATTALLLSGFLTYKTSIAAPKGGQATCYRTIDMMKLSKFMLSDMMEKTAVMNSQEAGQSYRARLSTLDAEVAKHADGCLLIRRDLAILPDPSIDITKDVAVAVGVDLNATPKKPTLTPQIPAPAGGAAPAPVTTTAIPNELGSKLD